MLQQPELLAPAGSLAALKAAIEAGADTVYLGLKNATNARNFAGLNFTESDIRAGVELAHSRGRQVLFAINPFVQAGRAPEWRSCVTWRVSPIFLPLVCTNCCPGSGSVCAKPKSPQINRPPDPRGPPS